MTMSMTRSSHLSFRSSSVVCRALSPAVAGKIFTPTMAASSERFLIHSRETDACGDRANRASSGILILEWKAYTGRLCLC